MPHADIEGDPDLYVQVIHFPNNENHHADHQSDHADHDHRVHHTHDDHDQYVHRAHDDHHVHRAHDDDQAGSSINLTCVVNHLPERQVIRWKHKVNHQYEDLDHDDYYD